MIINLKKKLIPLKLNFLYFYTSVNNLYFSCLFINKFNKTIEKIPFKPLPLNTNFLFLTNLLYKTFYSSINPFIFLATNLFPIISPKWTFSIKFKLVNLMVCYLDKKNKKLFFTKSCYSKRKNEPLCIHLVLMLL